MCCGGNAKRSQEDIDRILATLPQAVLVGIGDNPLASGIQQAMPLDDGTKRVYARPTVNLDGSIEYTPVEGVAPPMDIDGFVRDKANPWKFLPLWPLCHKRMHGVRRGKTGAINVVMVCNDPKSEHHQRFVSVDKCLNCPLIQKKSPAQPEG